MTLCAVTKADKGSQRYKDCYGLMNQQPSMGTMMTSSIGSMMSEFKGTVSKDNCIAVRKSMQVGGMLDAANDVSSPLSPSVKIMLCFDRLLVVQNLIS